MIKILIIGASGFLGKKIFNTLKNNINYIVYGSYFNNPQNELIYADITDKTMINNLFDLLQPNIVILTSALTNVDYCETHMEKAYTLNVLGTNNIIAACDKYKSKLIYISSEYIFDGENGPYKEIDKPNPINFYGKTKLLNENNIINTLNDFLIIRTTIIYGWDNNSKNFIMQLINNLNNKKIMKVPMDQISSPTFCPNLAEIIAKCCNDNISGIYNIVGTNCVNRYSFACMAADILGYDKNFIIPVKTSELNKIAKRPLNAGLLCDKIVRDLGVKLISPEEGLNIVKKEKELYEN